LNLEVLEYRPERASENPPLLFVHGGSHGAWCWKEHFLPYFAAKGFHSYALSFRGHGQSEGREKLETFSLLDYSDDLLQVMQQINSKPVLIGHSLGGSIVQRVWSLHPDSMRAVVLLSSTPPRGMLKEWAKIVSIHFRLIYKMYMYNRGKSTNRGEKIIERLLFPLSTPVEESTIFPSIVADRLFFPPNLSAESKQEYLRLLQPESLVAAEGMLRQALDVNSMNTNIPILVLGSRKDAFLSEKIAFMIARDYKTRATIFSDICHDMMLDPKWKTVADVIVDFLQEYVP